MQREATSSFAIEYLGFFDCFNSARYFEAHEVLESLWLRVRTGPDGRFYQALIQTAAAFVHWQRERPDPARRLFALAETKLRPYAPQHLGLDVRQVLVRLEEWRNLSESRLGVPCRPGLPLPDSDTLR